MNRRKQARLVGLRPVRISGADASGCVFQKTLDLSPHGIRLGTLRHKFKVGDRVLGQFRQNSSEFEERVKTMGPPEPCQTGSEKESLELAVGSDLLRLPSRCMPLVTLVAGCFPRLPWYIIVVRNSS
jgi:hypothetical protein